MKSVAGFGIANVDIIFGNASRMPQLGEEIYSENCSKQLGGGAVATLIQLARLGVPVNLATYIGSGERSQYLLKELEKNEITYTNMLETEEEDPVTLSCIVSCHQDRGIISYKPEDSAFSVEDSKVYEFYKGNDIAFLSLEQKELCKPLKEAGCLIVLDSAWSDMLSMELYSDVFQYVDYFIPNSMEAMKITGADSAGQALETLAKHLKNPIVKNGNAGCLYKENDIMQIIEPLPVPHVDSTGAGDAFAAGFMYGLYYGYDLADCIRFGNITGGNAVTMVGCLAAQMDEEKLLDYFREVYARQPKNK
ncbi:MAG: carbohydrate kinase family protein [Clostridia bacterium]|nr:carbohydrate kinase family protein [Clostridia bacterium]NCC45069.1 carbohydrate kinase family protein [Clostridia bacterium]